MKQNQIIMLDTATPLAQHEMKHTQPQAYLAHVLEDFYPLSTFLKEKNSSQKELNTRDRYASFISRKTPKRQCKIRQCSFHIDNHDVAQTFIFICVVASFI